MNPYLALTGTPSRRRPPLFPGIHAPSSFPGSLYEAAPTRPVPTPTEQAPHRHAHADTYSPTFVTSPNRSPVPSRRSRPSATIRPLREPLPVSYTHLRAHDTPEHLV